MHLQIAKSDTRSISSPDRSAHPIECHPPPQAIFNFISFINYSIINETRIEIETNIIYSRNLSTECYSHAVKMLGELQDHFHKRGSTGNNCQTVPGFAASRHQNFPELFEMQKSFIYVYFYKQFQIIINY